jgi:hypothetical protein
MFPRTSMNFTGLRSVTPRKIVLFEAKIFFIFLNLEQLFEVVQKCGLSVTKHKDKFWL